MFLRCVGVMSPSSSSPAQWEPLSGGATTSSVECGEAEGHLGTEVQVGGGAGAGRDGAGSGRSYGWAGIGVGPVEIGVGRVGIGVGRVGIGVGPGKNTGGAGFRVGGEVHD